MKKLSLYSAWVSVLCLLFLPQLSLSQTDLPKSSPPPIGQQMVREGDLAVKLVAALGIGTVEDEIEAETTLGNMGISPRNGWIADYPVTPDIIGEMYKSVRNAAASGKLSMSVEEATEKVKSVCADLSLAITPFTSANADMPKTPDSDGYPNQTIVNNYYTNEGPPVVTYYTPPPDYYYLYSWVPYPFWGFGFWFPGFFILNDFHRVVHVHGRTVFVSNHFNDIRNHRVFRVDPVSRFRGRTFAGIGVTNSRRFISTGVPRSGRMIFNTPGMRRSSGGSFSTPSRSGSFSAPSRGGGGGRAGGGGGAPQGFRR